jgi:acyl-CoA thioester hydrolase
VEVLHSTVVAPEEIDHLGHMNVMFYGVHARTGADRVLASLGLACDGETAVLQCDTYVRHHREQVEGASLDVRGGVLEASSTGVRLYEELVNAATDELAATFVLTFVVTERATGAPRPIDPDVLAAVQAKRIDLPEHGLWRSISPDDDVVASAPTLDLLEARDLAQRQIRAITPEECDEDGVVTMFPVAALVWGGEPMPGRAFQPLHQLADGGQMGFATMETRSTWARFPRIGDRVQSFGAEVERGPKTMLTRNWVYDVDRADLVAVFSVVNVAFDLTTRRAIAVPEDLRRRWDPRLHPDLA